MTLRQKLLVIPLLTLGLTACGIAPTVEQQSEMPDVNSLILPSLKKMTIPLGFELHRIQSDTGEKDNWRAIAVNEAGDVTVVNSDGCVFQFQSEIFSPILSWEECGSNPKWNTGTRKITAVSGSLWPLQVGNTSSYDHQYAFSSGNTGSGTRTCEVTGTVKSIVPMGEFDAFIVQCRDDFGDVYEISTWHISPEVGEIRYMREHSEKGLIRNVGVERVVTGDNT